MNLFGGQIRDLAPLWRAGGLPARAPSRRKPRRRPAGKTELKCKQRTFTDAITGFFRNKKNQCAKKNRTFKTYICLSKVAKYAIRNAAAAATHYQDEAGEEDQELHHGAERC